MRWFIRGYDLEKLCRRWYHPLTGELVFIDRRLPDEDFLACEAMKLGDDGRFRFGEVECRVDVVAWVQKIGKPATLHFVVRPV